MAQPPAMIAQTFKRDGSLQMNRLAERARFRCVQCQQHKVATLVATISGDWNRTLCAACHSILLSQQAEKAKRKQEIKVKVVQPDKAKKAVRLQKKVARPKPRAVHVESRSAKRPRRPKLGDEPLPMEARERAQLEQQLPRIDRLLEFFRTAGVRAELVRGGGLWINGRQTLPLVKILPTRERLDWNSVIDAMTVSYACDKFIAAIGDNARFGDGLRAFLRRRERGFAIMRGEVQLATIHATHAQIPHRNVIYANFLNPGPHWQKVADVLRGAEGELVAEWGREQDARAASYAAAYAAAEAEAAEAAAQRRAVTRRRIDQFPEDLAPDLVDACLDASRRIRLERQAAYERPVVLECYLGELTLLPITGTLTRLLAPFRLKTGSIDLNGELVIGDSDPLPVLINAAVTDEDAITAWTCALLGFADATCIEVAVAQTPQRELPKPRQPGSDARRPRSMPSLPHKRTWPAHLEPVGSWVRYSGAFVAGHRRHLNDGQTASDEARDRARQVGIHLHSYETWVRPHARGVPDGIEMRFLWNASTELKAATAENADRSGA